MAQCIEDLLHALPLLAWWLTCVAHAAAAVADTCQALSRLSLSPGVWGRFGWGSTVAHGLHGHCLQQAVHCCALPSTAVVRASLFGWDCRAAGGDQIRVQRGVLPFWLVLSRVLALLS